jgi:prepilin-type N-terminal cleavage/methylation domain-containing protein
VTNTDEVTARVLRHSCFGINSSFVIRNPSFRRAFTLIELIVVVGIIAILSALVLSTVGYARKKAARARAETEIAAISAACESYKADNGIYPQSGDTNTLDPTSNFDSTPPAAGQTNAYSQASLYLYEKLFGATSGTRSEIPSSRSYFTFKPNMLYPTDTSLDVIGLRDPFGNLYGYSTRMAATGSGGYNPTFDLWSTGGGTTTNDVPTWIKNC